MNRSRRFSLTTCSSLAIRQNRSAPVATIALAASDATWFASFQRGVRHWVQQRLPHAPGN